MCTDHVLRWFCFEGVANGGDRGNSEGHRGDSCFGLPGRILLGMIDAVLLQVASVELWRCRGRIGLLLGRQIMWMLCQGVLCRAVELKRGDLPVNVV